MEINPNAFKCEQTEDMVQFIAAQLYLFTECLLQHMVQFIAAQLYLFTKWLQQHMTEKWASFKADNPENKKLLPIYNVQNF